MTVKRNWKRTAARVGSTLSPGSRASWRSCGGSAQPNGMDASAIFGCSPRSSAYTNAGKSTLLNALTGAQAFAEDKLFATLDPTTAEIAPAHEPKPAADGHSGIHPQIAARID